jgi:predicted nucleotide-binding protein
VPAPALQVTVPIGHELLGQCIKQGHALVQRASLVGDFSDYESWKSARKQWIDPTVQALEHMYSGPGQARDFLDAVSCPEDPKRWQEQYAADLKCVKDAIDVLTLLQGELAFTGNGESAGATELTAGDPQPAGGSASAGATDEPPVLDAGTIDYQQVRPNGVTEQPAQAAAAAAADDGDGDGDGDAHDAAAGASDRGAAEHELVEQPAPAADLETPEPQRTPSVSSFAEPPRGEAAEREPGVGAELTPAQQVGSQLAHHANGATPAERDPAGGPAPARTRQVLLAHGRDERWKQAVEHLLEQAGEHEIRIINQRSGERSRLADALDDEPATPSRYAVVLLTADDVGGPRLESDSEPFFSTRAHQEVVFQMGFLVAALSPGRVCVLYEDGVELPYELDGVSHVRLDLAGMWQPKLLLHLRRAGFDYDMNKLVAV